MENITTSLVQVMESLEHLNKRYADAFIPFVVVIGIMALIGVIGNVIVLLVFCLSKEYKYTNFKIFVICLALLDLLSCVTIIPAEIATSRNFFSFHSLTLCKLKCFFNVFFCTAAAMILLTICIDRFRKVCKPLKKQIYPGLALKIVVVAMVFSFVVSLPAPILGDINPANKTNIYNITTTVYICTFEKQSILTIIYRFGLSLILFGGSITLIIMYVLIGRIVIRQWRVRKSIGIISPSGVPYKTLIWLIVTIIFIVTYFLFAVLSFFTTLQMSPQTLLGYIFLFRIYFINNIINPLIYAWLDRRFKRSCKELYVNAKRKILCYTE